MKKLKFLFFPTILVLAFGLMLSCSKSSSNNSSSSGDSDSGSDDNSSGGGGSNDSGGGSDDNASIIHTKFVKDIILLGEEYCDSKDKELGITICFAEDYCCLLYTSPSPRDS